MYFTFEKTLRPNPFPSSVKLWSVLIRDPSTVILSYNRSTPRTRELYIRHLHFIRNPKLLNQTFLFVTFYRVVIKIRSNVQFFYYKTYVTQFSLYNSNQSG